MAENKQTMKGWLAQLAAYFSGLEDGETIGEDQLNEFLEINPIPSDDAGDPYQQIQDFYDRVKNDPEFRAQVMDKKNKASFEKALGLATDIVTTGAEISDAKEQIRQAELEESKLVKPTGPTPLKKNVKLQAAMRRAEQDLAGEGDAAFLSPYERQAQDQYAKDIALAKTASTGQAGALGAMGQAASSRRLQGARNLIPTLANKRQQDFANMTGLVGMDISEDQAIKRQQMQRYGQDLGQYNLDRDLISRTGSAGMTNRAMARRTMGSQIAEALGDPLYSALPMKSRNFLNPVMNSYKNELSK